MSKELEKIICDHIQSRGFIDVGQFMSLALGHPEYGYYMTRDPLGKEGDFTTAPEISQMFGEVIAAWVVDIWLQMGKPPKLTLLECGPGRGTLMSDIVRASSVIDGFGSACSIHLLETSSFLREVQKTVLRPHEPQHHISLQTVPEDAPLIVIANEFLDALPTRQAELTAHGWKERVVVLNEKEGTKGKNAPLFSFRIVSLSPLLEGYLPKELMPNAKVGDVIEFSPSRDLFVRDLCRLIKRCGAGAGLFIDYGHVKSSIGNTLQAIHKHQFFNPLEKVGEADITTHVNFASLRSVSELENCAVTGPITQREFLKLLGIDQRARILLSNANEKQAQEIHSALTRLTSKTGMGELFKVLGVSYGGA